MSGSHIADGTTDLNIDGSKCELADYYRSRGASDAFIHQALGTPSNKIWVADRALMMSSGYASNPWEAQSSLLIHKCNHGVLRIPAL